jgi:hypothetical protein
VQKIETTSEYRYSHPSRTNDTVGTALGNAIFAATGKRIRTQPFGANGVTFV